MSTDLSPPNCPSRGIDGDVASRGETWVWRSLPVNRPTAAQLSWVRRVLALEGASAAGEQSAQAAGRLHEALCQELGPILGITAVQALLARSAELAQPEFSFLEADAVSSPAALRDRLAAQPPPDALAAVSLLFAFFFALLAELIGHSMMSYAVGRAFPGLGPDTSWGDL